MTKQKWILVQISLGLILFLPIMALSIVSIQRAIPAAAQAEPAQPEVVVDSYLSTANNCRYGAAYTGAPNMLEDLEVGSVINFVASQTDYGETIDYLPMVRFKQNKDINGNRLPSYTVTPPLTENGLGRLIDLHPSSVWLIGNEVDRIDVQDDMMPDLYAEAYHEVYTFIKERDPSALTAISGLVRISPGRLQYLDIVWDSYLEKYGEEIPVDVWNMHAYNLPEVLPDGSDSSASVAIGTDRDLAYVWGGGLIPPRATKDEVRQICSPENRVCLFEQDDMTDFITQVVNMRVWMKEHGQQNKPLILSEYSILSPYAIDDPNDPSVCFLKDELGNCFAPPRIDTFMRDSLNYLETAADPNLGYPLDDNRLVQQWYWYPTLETNDDAAGSSSRLVNSDGVSLSFVGQTYAEYGANPDNLFTELIGEQPPAAVSATSPVTLTLSTVFRNRGTIPTTGPVTVEFRDDVGNVISSTSIDAGIRGCAIYPETVSFEWPDLPAGTHKYNVFINGSFSGSSFVIVEPPHQVYLASVVRK